MSERWSSYVPTVTSRGEATKIPPPLSKSSIASAARRQPPSARGSRIAFRQRGGRRIKHLSDIDKTWRQPLLVRKLHHCAKSDPIVVNVVGKVFVPHQGALLFESMANPRKDQDLRIGAFDCLERHVACFAKGPQYRNRCGRAASANASRRVTTWLIGNIPVDVK